MCMTMRGVKKPGARTITTTYRGVFKEDLNLRKETLGLIKS
jgi:GTP cyclohydrolase I